MKRCLTIAGSDSSGGAGIQADLKTFSALGTFGMSVVTSVTAQNTLGVQSVYDLPPDVVAAQMEAVFSDIAVDAVKIGMVSAEDTIGVIAEKMRYYRPEYLIIDPVMVSKNGCPLLKSSAVKALKEQLLPLAWILTPNLEEAQVLVDRELRSAEEVRKAAAEICAMGARSVLIKGGHLEGEPIDTFFDGEKWTVFHGTRLKNKNTHGTGCTLSSAIAAYLARGLDCEESIRQAKGYVATGILHGIELGHGIGPTHHFYDLYRKAGLLEEDA